MTDHEDRVAAARHTVDSRHADLDKRLSDAPAHTDGGVPTSPLSGLAPQEQALYEAKVILDATTHEPAPVEHIDAQKTPRGHERYIDANAAIDSANLAPYRGRGALVTRGTDSVCVEVNGTVVAMVGIPESSDESSEREQLHNYLAAADGN